MRAVVLGTVLAAGGLPIGSARASSRRVERHRRAAVPSEVTLTLTRSRSGHRTPAGFLGLSLEYDAVEAYAGTDPGAIDPVFLQLVRNLAPDQAPVLRIGGDSTDWTWWPVPDLPRPPGIRYALTPVWLQVTRALAQALRAHLILGINLEADSEALAASEATALTMGLGRASLEALEPGNEPELYSFFPWYTGPTGVPVLGRPPGYDFNDYTRDFSQVVSALAPVPLAGPAVGASAWFRHLPGFLAAEPRVRLVTLHRYPLTGCGPGPTRPGYPTLAHLLAPHASRGLARSVAQDVKIAHARHLSLRVDEINTDSCGSDPALTHSFASALWVLATLFQMASVGVDGVNIHTFPGATYDLFGLSDVNGTWSASVEPEYYGMLMFAQAAPPGAALLPLSGVRGSGLSAWATRGRHGVIRVVLINEGSRPRRVAVRPAEGAAATLERLLAPGILAQQGVTLGGRSFGPQTGTGLLTGPPCISSVKAVAGRYLIKLPPASAAMLTLRSLLRARRGRSACGG